MPNRLAQETSPYLLQHKDNPVDWYPWGEEALKKAKEEDKPILLSIGYSACHWCHVMEHESFEDPETAELMNREFVNIKVDREERPDIDNLYMTAVQAMTGHGGWPLNVFLTPDGVPFYGGTYWPPDDRQGMPSFTKVLESVADAYRERREGVEENAERLRAYLKEATKATPAPGDLDPHILDQAAKSLARTFDGEHGGFGGAPKFPQAAVLEFLLRYRRRTGDERAGSMATQTLDAMANGGIYDQIGGGFHRYAVDAIWLVPHFEKMLYDNAQLARVYLDAYRAFGHDRYRRVATETLEYVVREMSAPDGGFAATQDADSEGEEGKFYVWTPEEIDEVLGPEDGRLVREYYGVTRRGNFEGKNILHVRREPRFVAAELEVPVEKLLAAIERAKKELYEARAKRVWPGRDEKVLLAWNGMMLRAFAEGSRVLDRADFREVAERAATFLLDHLRQDGKLLRTYKDGRAKIAGYLEDYANLADGLISLYEATFERRWIEAASEIVETMLVEFAGQDGPMLFDTGISGEQLISRPRDLQDGATPSGNAVAASVLLRLGLMTGRESYTERAGAMLKSMVRPMAEHPTAFGRWLCALDAYLATPREIAVTGERTDPALAALTRVVFTRYEPNAIVGYVDPADPTIAELLPFLAHRPIKNGKATAYLCEHFACMPPVNDPADLETQLEQGTGVTWRDF